VSVITLFSGAFCKDDIIIDEVVASTGFKPITDKVVVAEAAKASGLDEEKVRRAFTARTSVFNKFTHEKERAIAYLKLALAGILSEENLLISGYCAQLVPATISHVLRVCLIADLEFRTAVAADAEGLTENEAVRVIRREDEDRMTWVEFLHNSSDPWDTSLYDLVIPMHKTTTEQASALIQHNVLKEVVSSTRSSRKAIADFYLSAQIDVALSREGHQVAVSAEDGKVTLTINKHVLMLSRLEEELKSIVTKIPGVRSVETKTGKDYHQTNIYRKHDFKVPAKVLLVDDEREFVQTLSERLQLRSMGAAVAYDGESALDLVRNDDPEVMIIDLKMPGVDGMEVLKKVNETRPEIEVIVLTGHGSGVDRERCMELGAFAYLQKPVDIDKLSEILKQAHEKIRRKKEAQD